MGILGTRWEGNYEGHAIAVTRNELTKGFHILWDGKEIAHKTWSLIGLGELHASAMHGDKVHDVKLALEWSLGTEGSGCKVTVDGNAVDMKHVS